MATRIRLARFGRKKLPFYHVVVTDSRARRDSGFIEKIGYFNPLLEKGKEGRLSLKNDRAEYWLGVGALPSDRVALLLIEGEVKGAEKYKPVFVPKQKKVADKPETEEAPKAEEEAKNEQPAAPEVEEAPEAEPAVAEAPAAEAEPVAAEEVAKTPAAEAVAEQPEEPKAE